MKKSLLAFVLAVAMLFTQFVGIAGAVTMPEVPPVNNTLEDYIANNNELPGRYVGDELINRYVDDEFSEGYFDNGNAGLYAILDSLNEENPMWAPMFSMPGIGSNGNRGAS